MQPSAVGEKPRPACVRSFMKQRMRGACEACTSKTAILHAEDFMGSFEALCECSAPCACRCAATVYPVDRKAPRPVSRRNIQEFPDARKWVRACSMAICIMRREMLWQATSFFVAKRSRGATQSRAVRYDLRRFLTGSPVAADATRFRTNEAIGIGAGRAGGGIL